jgi:NAD-dependent deacetylase
MSESGKIAQAARMLYESRRVVAFTGAGISTESGIPDFRSPGGVWSRYDPEELTYQKFMAHEENRRLYWEYDRARYPAMREAQPNPAHLALAELEKTGRLVALLTQNIDGLHQRAGNSPGMVYELHGTVHEVKCLKCGDRRPREEVTSWMERENVDVPYCALCGGPLKCATIAFGQRLDPETLEAAFAHAGDCDLFLTIGSSLVVQPAAALPATAKRNGAKLILVNLAPTPYDHIMDLTFRDKASTTMEAVMGELRRLEK